MMQKIYFTDKLDLIKSTEMFAPFLYVTDFKRFVLHFIILKSMHLIVK